MMQDKSVKSLYGGYTTSAPGTSPQWAGSGGRNGLSIHEMHLSRESDMDDSLRWEEVDTRKGNQIIANNNPSPRQDYQDSWGGMSFHSSAGKDGNGEDYAAAGCHDSWAMLGVDSSHIQYDGPTDDLAFPSRLPAVRPKYQRRRLNPDGASPNEEEEEGRDTFVASLKKRALGLARKKTKPNSSKKRQQKSLLG